MRMKQRHYICELSYLTSSSTERSAVNVSDIYHALKNEIIQKFGDVFWNKVASLIAVKYYNPITSLLLIRGPLLHQTVVRSCIENLHQVKKRNLSITILQTSGAMRKLKQYIIVWHEKKVFELRLNDSNLDDTKMRDEISSLFSSSPR